MTGTEVFLLVALLGVAAVAGLLFRWRHQLQLRVSELESVLEQQRPVVQAAPEVERQRQYYEAIARTVPEKDALLQRYSGIRNIEAHLALLQDQQQQWELHLRVLEQQSQARAASQQTEFREQQQKAELQLRELGKQKHELTATLDALEGRIAAHHVGLAGPRYDFREAEEYKNRLDLLRTQQEAMVKAGTAAVCSSEWTIDGDRKAGKKTTDAILKLMLRAFNGECDALVGRVRYDNLDSYTTKAIKSGEAINKLGAGFHCSISSAYLQLKLQELALVNGYQIKLNAEREEQRAIKEQMREEQRASQEIDKAEREAEQMAEKIQAAVDKAQREMAAAEGARQQKLQAQLQELERKLKEAEETRTRALSMAQQTRAGHVYVISNVGSFGEGVYKIGMTRRLDPQDRVDELGDASVPFRFDVHAMIYTNNAPRLEKALHDQFDSRRVNRINMRKEFFRVSLEEIEQAVKKHHGEFKLTRLAEAEEYRRGLLLTEPGSTAVA